MLNSLIELKDLIIILLGTISGCLIIVGFRKSGFGLLAAALIMAIRGPLLMAVSNSFVNTLPPELQPYRNLILIIIILCFIAFLILRTKIIRSFLKAFFVAVSVDVFYALIKAPFRLFTGLFIRKNRRID